MEFFMENSLPVNENDVQSTAETQDTQSIGQSAPQADAPDTSSDKKKKTSNKKSKKSKNGTSDGDPAPVKKKRRRRLGDRKDGRKLRTINMMNKVMPYIMPMRCDATNTFADEVDISKTDKYVSERIIAGQENFSILHVIIAAYVRTIAQHPALNRFVSGQKIYARNDIQVVMAIKKSMSIEAPETCIKVWFEPDDTIDVIYEKFNAAVGAYNDNEEGETSSFDKLNKGFSLIPGFLLRFVVWVVRCLDYVGWLPRKFTDLLPFYGSMIITSMGSLGIKPIYHHIYNFGNLPIFVSYGAKRRENVLKADGSVIQKKYIDLKVVTDERICDGFQYAAGFKCWKKLIENPEILESPPEFIKEDID